MKFLARIQGHMFLVVEDDVESAKKALEKQFGDVELLDLTSMEGDFILEVTLADLTGSGLGLLKIDGGH